MRLSHRIAATTGVLALTLGGLAAAAPTAQATPAQCVSYLAVRGYTSMINASACALGANGTPGTYNCATLLIGAEGVPRETALWACTIAGR
ncbi:hypothetical protein ACFRCG_03220 [Embleya sp. NPDC056575]|uniref:hypothetical protein n=1 Tax=unclassified Embleya TaxID=2699296 RepID=UPI0036CE2F9F